MSLPNAYRMPFGKSLRLVALFWYVPFVAISNLLWEVAQLPLYTLWRDGRPGEIAFAAIHCTGGDVLIATVSLSLAILMVGRKGWPADERVFLSVASMAIGLGVSYTIFSEWLNVSVRKSWAYSELMPVLPVIGAGLSPILQWIVIPAIGFWLTRRAVIAQMPLDQASR